MARIILFLLVVACVAAPAGEPCPAFGSSIGYAKGDPRVTIAGLHGKAVLILFGQSWCPVCNGWTPDLLSQMQKAWGSKPGVVLLLVKTDGDAASGKEYLSTHGGDPLQWFVVGDAEATWTKQVMGKEALWQYAIVDPDGAIVDSGKAGQYFTKGNKNEFVLATSKPLAAAAQASRQLLPATNTWPASLDRAVRLAEAGCFAEAMSAAKSAPKAEQSAFRETLLASVTGRVDELAAVLSGQTPERFHAYMTLRGLAEVFKGSAPGKAAVESLRATSKDKTMQREVAAEKAWVGAEARINAMPVGKRDAALKSAQADFAKIYGDTWYAKHIGVVK